MDLVKIMVGNQPAPLHGCMMIWAACLMILEGGRKLEHTVSVLQQMTDTQRTLMRAITISRKGSEIDNFVKKLTEPCCCKGPLMNIIGRRFHMMGKTGYEEAGAKQQEESFFMSALISVLIWTPSNSLYKVEKNMNRYERHLGYIPFPAAPRDLYPEKDVTGIHMLVQWLVKCDVNTDGLRLLSCLFRSCKGSGLPTFVLTGHGPALYTQLLTRACLMISAQNAFSIEIVLKDIPIFDKFHTVLCEFTTDMELQAFGTGAGIQRLGDILGSAYRSMDYMISANSQLRTSTTKAILSRWAVFAGRLHNVTQYGMVLGQHPGALISSCDTYEREQADHWLQAFRIVHFKMTGQRCGAVCCCATHSTAQRAFGVCAGCGVVRYCSTTCQRKEWFSHKTLCRANRAVRVCVEHQVGGIRQTEGVMSEKVCSVLKRQVPAQYVDTIYIKTMGSEAYQIKWQGRSLIHVLDTESKILKLR